MNKNDDKEIYTKEELDWKIDYLYHALILTRDKAKQNEICYMINNYQERYNRLVENEFKQDNKSENNENT